MAWDCAWQRDDIIRTTIWWQSILFAGKTAWPMAKPGFQGLNRIAGHKWPPIIEPMTGSCDAWHHTIRWMESHRPKPKIDTPWHMGLSFVVFFVPVPLWKAAMLRTVVIISFALCLSLVYGWEDNNFNGITQVALVVHNLEEATRFYTDLGGMLVPKLSTGKIKVSHS